MSTSSPAFAGNSKPVTPAIPSAPIRRRGRPRIHENDSAKKAAYRARLRERRPPPKFKHNRACRGTDACLCDLPMSKGLFLNRCTPRLRSVDFRRL